MYSKILVPLDGSPWSEWVLPYVRFLADALGIKVELLQMIDPEAVTSYSDPEHGRYVDIVGSTMKDETAHYLRKTAQEYFDTSQVICAAEIGKAAEVIVDKAALSPDALIAMSTHGRSSIPRWLLGSVADKVLHAAVNPILLVRPNGHGVRSGPISLKKIIAPLDGSALAELTLLHVRELAKKLDMEVVLVRSYDQMVQGHVPYADRIKNKFRDEAKTYLESKVTQLTNDGIKRVSYLMPQGNAAENIVDITRETADNLVAICTHGRSGIGRWVLGSVTDHVVRHSIGPVLIIRAVS